MTIDTGNTVYVGRNNIHERIKDYRNSLTRWSVLPFKVLVIENSGYGNPFKDITDNSSNITYLSKKIHHIESKGKGYGEAHTIYNYSFG